MRRSWPWAGVRHPKAADRIKAVVESCFGALLGRGYSMGQERRDGPRKDLRQLDTAQRQYGDGPRRQPGTIISTPATLSRIRVLEMF